MGDHFNFRSRLKLILVFISFFAIIFSFYLFIVLKLILVIVLLTVKCLPVTLVHCIETAEGITTSTYKYLHGLAPPYLTRFCTPLTAVSGRTQLRSADQHKLLFVRPSYVYLHAGSTGVLLIGPIFTWNALPRQLRDPAISINIFRQSLKSICLTVINCV